MIIPCKNCGRTVRCLTKRIDAFEAVAQIRCVCGRKTSEHYAFWASDAGEAAREEWKDINK